MNALWDKGCLCRGRAETASPGPEPPAANLKPERRKTSLSPSQRLGFVTDKRAPYWTEEACTSCQPHTFPLDCPRMDRGSFKPLLNRICEATGIGEPIGPASPRKGGMRTDRISVFPICEMDGKSPDVHKTDPTLLSSPGGPLPHTGIPRAPSTPDHGWAQILF